MSERSQKLLKQFCATEEGFGVEEISYNRLETFKKSVADPAELSPIEALKVKALACTACALSKSRKKVVFGEGNLKADLMFIGESPGSEDDKQGRPFAGEDGKLLTKIIEAMHLKREDVYITNCLKCRAQNNRNPLQEEIDSCSPYLQQQIQLIKPKVICALGSFAAQTLLRTETPIMQLRGKFKNYQGIKLMPTLHPSHLLNNPSDKKYVWSDMQAILRELGLPIPQPGK